ncbi:MAG: hypothetical protein IJU82_04350 [Ruminiclostridium sp.]|nr:hypothetical protein [Ruminiclostridium sp.]
MKHILKYLVIFLLCAALLTGMLTATALIPADAVRDNMRSSAELLCGNKVFFNLSENISASKIDRYADSILLNIVYHYDSADPLVSVMRSSYYFTDTQNENDNLLDAITGEYGANKEYLRYWHGSGVIVKALHLFTDILGIYIINAIVMVLLYGLLLYVLIKNRLYAGAVGTLCALAAAGIWYVPFSLEYTWVFMIMPVISVIAVKLVLAGKPEKLGTLFLISGIVTNYFDFLTSETVTLTVPLLLAIYTSRQMKSASVRSEILPAVRNGILWGVGYAGMWLTKWGLAAVILGEDVIPLISEHIAERSLGSGLSGNLLGDWWNNISCLFPLGFGGAGVIAAVLLTLAAAYVSFVYRRDGVRPSGLLIYAVIGIVPLIRYAVLFNHSTIHYFFTYRALVGTILAVCLVIAELVGFGRAKHETGKRKRA